MPALRGVAPYQQGAMIERTLMRRFHSLAELDDCEVPEASVEP